jgi:hypothetical protein
MSVGRAQREISSREFGEWMAYEEMDPGEPERSDLRAALIACTIANTALTKRSKPYDIQDFLLKFDEVRAKPTSQKEASRELRIKMDSWRKVWERRRAARAAAKAKR